MKKVLVVGCSHSTRSWETQQDGIERISDKPGYWEHLPTHNEYTVYGQVGSGYAGFATILSELDRTNRLHNFDICIIQESWEPRLVFYLQQDDEDYEEFVYNNVTYRELGSARKLFANYFFTDMCKFRFKVEEKYNITFNDIEQEYMNRLVENAHTDHLVQSSVSLCNRLLEKNNVQGYYFSFNEQAWHHRYMQRIDIPIVTDLMFFDEQYHNFDDTFTGHLNYNGNKRLGTMLANAMKEIL